MLYRLGLDIGIKSIGWCIIECDKNGEPIGIVALNSRIFDAAEVPKTGAPLAEPRRLARGLRRRLRRKTARLEGINRLFEENGIGIFDRADGASIKPSLRNINVLGKRVEALDKIISEEEFARVLYSIARHRGFKSVQKRGAQSEEDGKLLKAIEKNDKEMDLLGLRTIGEYLYKVFAVNKRPVHNKGGDYSMCISRDSLEREVRILFDRQRQFGNKFANEENLEKYLYYFGKQRTFDEGPGQGSQYSGTHSVRKCIFYKDLDCAAKGTYSNELSTAYQKLNNLQIIDWANGGDKRSLTQAEKEKIIERAQAKEYLTYKDIRKMLGYEKNEDIRFNALNYSVRRKNKKDAPEETENIFKCEESKFISLANSNKIRKYLPNDIKNDVIIIDEIAEICTKYTNENLFRDAIDKSLILHDRLDEETISGLLTINMTGYGHLSIKALREILPFLKEGCDYSKACEKAGHNHSQFTTEKGKYLGKKSEVRELIEGVGSPVVKRALSQAIKVIDAIIRQYGSPFSVNIELAREMSQTRQERDKSAKDNQDRASANETIKARLIEMNADPTATNILKLKLYDEQTCKCVYSGRAIDPERMFKEEKYCEIDHIIPYSRSFDDSFNNKVLVLSEENQNKRNSIPYEYFERIGREWDEFETRVKTIYSNKNGKKLELLLKKKVDEDGWKTRALNDTRYASRMLANLIKDHLLFDSASRKKSVLTVNGKITSYLRRFWGIPKIRADGDKHHAVDASIIACVSDGVIQKLTHYNYAKEMSLFMNGKYILEDGEIASSEYYDKNSKFVLPYPYPLFREELIARTMDDELAMRSKLKEMGMSEEYISRAKPFVVSRMTCRKAKGTIHDATIWSSKYIADKNILVKRTPLEKLELSKDQEIKDYYNPDGDRALYETLKKRLIEFDGNGKKAFSEPIYKPCANGQGNIVRSVKTYKVYNGGGVILQKNTGIASNGSMIRIDLYSKNSKYYGVPVYTMDLYKGVLPLRASTANKPQNEWRVIDDTYTFEMSIYPNDLLKIENDKPIELSKIDKNDNSLKDDKISFVSGLVYFIKFGISGGSMTIEDTSGCYSKNQSIQNLKKITKCEIDVLGNVVELSNRPRVPQGLHLKK